MKRKAKRSYQREGRGKMDKEKGGSILLRGRGVTHLLQDFGREEGSD